MASNTIFTLLVIALGVYATGVLRALAARRRTEEPRPITWDAGQALCVFGLFMIFSAAANVAASLMVKRLGYGPRTPQAMALSGILVYVINLPTLLVLWRLPGKDRRPARPSGLDCP